MRSAANLSFLQTFIFAACAAILIGGRACACPTCGIGEYLSPTALAIYGTFVVTPFAISYGVYRYIRKISREE